MSAPNLAAIILKREKDLVAHFRRAGATSPEAAQTPAALGIDQGVAWRRLLDRAVIRSAPNGAVYLDEPSWTALRGTRRRMAVVLGLILLVIALGAIAWPR